MCPAGAGTKPSWDQPPLPSSGTSWGGPSPAMQRSLPGLGCSISMAGGAASLSPCLAGQTYRTAGSLGAVAGRPRLTPMGAWNRSPPLPSRGSRIGIRTQERSAASAPSAHGGEGKPRLHSWESLPSSSAMPACCPPPSTCSPPASEGTI